jgi:preprotein translocase SecE subunit
MGLSVYKPDQGKYTRLGSAFTLAVIVGLGCYRFYIMLTGTDLGLWVETMIPAGLFVILSGLSFWLVNTAVVADFMIAAEGEVKKVSWSSRKEIAVSTFIVIMLVLIIGVLLGFADVMFQLFFSWILS